MNDRSYSHGCHIPSTNNKSFSTINTGIMGNVVRKIVSAILPTEAQFQNVVKNRQSLSAPDILVDINLSTPILDNTPGIIKLEIPEEKESIINDQTKCLSNGDSPFDWYPIEAALENQFYLKETDISKKRQVRKRTKKFLDRKCSLISCSETHINPQQKLFVQSHICRNSKSGDKNRKQKSRRSHLVDMIEDIRSISDESESDLEVINLHSTQICNATDGAQLPLRMEKAGISTMKMSSLPISDKAIWQPTDQQTVLDCEKIDEDDDDSFVIFSEDVQQITPARSSSQRNGICAAINNFLVPQRRLRQISESSDDSIVFCDSDAASIGYQQNSDSEEIDQDSDICDESTAASVEHQQDSGSVYVEDEGIASLSQQLDSGFEEKKVRFNPVPKVHVMRMWNFAYRQARKGCWEMAARDRGRFKKRIEETERVLAAVFEPTRREHIFNERFSS